VTLGRSTYRVGDTINIGLRFNQPGAVAESPALAAEIETPGQPPEPILFEQSADDPALLTAALPASKAGAYTLRVVSAAVASSGGGASVRPSITTFRVEPPRQEIDEPSLNRPLLTDMARLTGGRVFELSQLDQLDAAIPIRQISRTIETRRELWNAPLLFGLALLCLTVEWILRKVYRMV
jgi:hypothetical protein